MREAAQGGWITPAPKGGVYIEVRAKPRSSKPGVEGGSEGALVVRISSPPADGAANEELISTLGKALGVPKSSLTLVRGASSRQKRILAASLTVDQALRKLSVTDP